LGRKIYVWASIVFAGSMLFSGSGCRRALGPLETAKEYERLYKLHDFSRKKLLTAKLEAAQVPELAPDFGGSNLGGILWVDGVFQSAAENAHGQKMTFGGEKITGDKAEVAYSLEGDPKLEMVCTFDLLKENGAWKIDGVGMSVRPHPEDISVGG